MAEINDDELISKEATERPLEFGKNLDVAAEALERFIQQLESMQTKAKGATGGLKPVREETEKLTLAEVELTKIEKQLATANARNTDEYRQQQSKLVSLKKEMKAKNDLGEREATTINKTNASLAQLTAALNKNREAYRNLANEEARASEEGQELLRIIQEQDEAVKEINESTGKFQDNVGAYPEFFQAATPGAYGFAQGLMTMAKASLAFIATPLGATLALIAVALAPVIAFLKGTGDGMDLVEKKTTGLKNGLSFLRDEFNELGRRILDGDTKFSKFLELLVKSNPIVIAAIGSFKALRAVFPDIAKGFDEAVKAGEDYADMMDTISTRRQFQNVEFLKEENAIKRLILQSKNRTLSEQQRIALIDEALAREKKLTDQRIKNAEDELLANYRLAKSRTTLTQAELAAFDTQEQAAIAMAEAFDKRDETLRDSLLEALANLEEARSGSLVIEEKLMAQRDKLEDDAAEKAKKRQEEELKRLKELEEARLKEFNRVEKNIDKAGAKIASTLSKPVPIKIFADIETGIVKATDTVIYNFRRMQENLNGILNNIQQVFNTFIVAGADLFKSFSDRRIEGLVAEQRELDARYQKEIKNAGDNAAAKEAIDAKYNNAKLALEKKIVAEKQKQARLDKAMAIFQIALETAKNIVKFLGNPLLVAAAVALGALQTAAVLAKPIPQYFRGTKHSKKGKAWVGEKGTELMRKPGKDWELTPDTATLVDIPGGTEIIPHEETLKRLALMALQQNGGTQAYSGELALIQEVRSLKAALRENGNKGNTNLLRSMSVVYEAKENHKGDIKIIRGINMGRWVTI